jgi:hypothetical protein
MYGLPVNQDLLVRQGANCGPRERHGIFFSAAFGLTPSNCQANESLVHGVATEGVKFRCRELAKAGKAVAG